MAASDSCVPLLGMRQWPRRKPRPSGEAFQKFTDTMFIYEGYKCLGYTFPSYELKARNEESWLMDRCKLSWQVLKYLFVARET